MALTSQLDAALERLADKSAVIVHGDLQRKNVLVDHTGHIGVLDWEHALRHGPPGFDLLFLAVTSRAPAAYAAAVRDLAAGRDPRGTPVLTRLAAIGLDGPDVRAALVVALHVWAADERIRRCALGVPRQPARFEPLLSSLVGAPPPTPR